MEAAAAVEEPMCLLREARLPTSTPRTTILDPPHQQSLKLRPRVAPDAV